MNHYKRFGGTVMPKSIRYNDANYRCVKLDFAAYEPALRSYPKKYIKICVPCKEHIKKAEQALFDYNNERSRLAPFIYKVAKCALRIRAGKKFKGIAIDIKKESFRPDKIKNSAKQFAMFHSYFNKKLRYSVLTITILVGVALLTIVAGLYPAIKFKNFTITWGVIVVFSVFLLIANMPLMVISGSLATFFSQRFKRALDGECLQYADNIYDSLEFVGQAGEKFLYDIKTAHSDEVELAYKLFGFFYKANESRACMQNICPERKRYFYNSTV